MSLEDVVRRTTTALGSTRWSLVCTALLAALFFSLGWTSADLRWLSESANETGRPPFSDSLTSILATNLGAALLLFSGVVTLGLSSIVSVGLVSTFIGASMRAVTTNLGWTGTLDQSGAYMFIEFAGVGVAGAAGLLPVVAGVRAALSDDAAAPGFMRVYLRVMPRALGLFLIALALFVTAAVIEAVL